MKLFDSGKGMMLLSLLIILAVVLFSTFSHAQVPYVASDFQINGGMGYMNPILSGKFGAENFGKRLYINSYGEYAWARKLETGDGHTLDGLAEVAYVHKNGFYGGGISAGRGYTSQWSKGSIHPMLIAGFDNWYIRFTGRYKFKGTDDRNQAQSFGGELDWKLSKRWRFNNGVEYVRFNYTDVPQWHRQGVKMWYGVKFLLKNDPIKAGQ
jgi:hypothetical protein